MSFRLISELCCSEQVAWGRVLLCTVTCSMFRRAELSPHAPVLQWKVPAGEMEGKQLLGTQPAVNGLDVSHSVCGFIEGNPLNGWFSKHGSQMSSSIWELTRNADFQAPRQTYWIRN